MWSLQSSKFEQEFSTFSSRRRLNLFHIGIGEAEVVAGRLRALAGNTDQTWSVATALQLGNDMDAVLTQLNEYLADVPGITVDKIIELRGRYTASLEYRPCSTSIKGFHTPMYESPELAQSVMDTFAPAKGNKEIDTVNIFSSEMFEYLSAEILGDKAVSMTIKSVVESELAGPRGTDMKVMIAFNERPKKLILTRRTPAPSQRYSARRRTTGRAAFRTIQHCESPTSCKTCVWQL